MIDRPVAIVCTGYGAHTVRELVVLVPVRPRTDLEDARQAVTEEYAAALQRGFGVAESVTVVEGGLGTAPKRRVHHKSDARLVVTAGIGWQVVSRGWPCDRSPLVLPIAWVVAWLAEQPQDGGRPQMDVRPGSNA